MHGLKVVTSAWIKGRFTSVSQSCRVCVRVINPFYFTANKCGETHSDEIHQLILWNPLEASDFIALNVFLFFFF